MDKGVTITDSRLKDMKLHLDGIVETYGLGQHQGECKKKYVVVRDEGSLGFDAVSTDTVLYSAMLYVPADEPFNMEPFVQEVKKRMLGLHPMFAPTGVETQTIHDDDKKAWMYSIQYRVYKKKMDW